MLRPQPPCASVEPSSTTTQSTTGRLCARTLSMASRTKDSALCAGMIAPTLAPLSCSATNAFSRADGRPAASPLHLLPLARGPAGAHPGGGLPGRARGGGPYGPSAHLRSAARRHDAARAREEARRARGRLALAALPQAALAARDGDSTPWPAPRRRRGSSSATGSMRCTPATTCRSPPR